MTVQKKKCPHCGYTQTSSYYHKSSKYSYGSPVTRCPKCGEIVVDRDIIEIAVDGVRKPDLMPVSPAGIFYGIFGLVMFIASKGSFFFLLIGLFFPAIELSSYEKRKEMIKKETAESEARLNNPVYAALLKKLGYNVPQKYLV